MEEKTLTYKRLIQVIKYHEEKSSSILLQSKTYLTNSSLSTIGSSLYTSANSGDLDMLKSFKILGMQPTYIMINIIIQ